MHDEHAEKRDNILQRINQALPGSPQITSDKALALTADNRVVAHDDEEAAFVLVGAGGSLPQDIADELGVTGKKPAEKEPAKGGVTFENAAPVETVSVGGKRN